MDTARAAVRSVSEPADARAICDIGRQARLELTFAVRGGRTILEDSYAEPPFRVGRCLRGADANAAHLILASSAPGVFGGDCLQQAVTVEGNARVRLTSQSAMQAHATANGAAATIASTYRVAPGGCLQCVWDPLIPFPDARLRQRIEIDLAAGASLFWSDAFMSGREARRERWQFAQLSHELRLARSGVPAYIERYDIGGHGMRPTRRWVADDACYFGTALIAGTHATRDAAASLHGELAAIDGIRGAADYIDDHLVLVRLTASHGLPFHEARALVATRLTATHDLGLRGLRA
jgi:urease accessory protein